MPKKILLIEDDPFLIDIYTTKLKEQGLETIIIKDGACAIDAIKKNNPDIILLDVILPNFDGWQILEQIAKDPTMASIKTIVLSNLSQEEDLKKGLALGARKYFIKSNHTPSEIINEIKKLL